jgi:PilZ domain
VRAGARPCCILESGGLEWINRVSSRPAFALANPNCFYTLRLMQSDPARLQAGKAVEEMEVLEIMLTNGTQGPEPGSQERRTMRRFDMRLPAIVRLEGASEFHTETQNVSARGVFLYLDRAIAAGTRLEVTLTFPPHITLTDAVRVRFTARVIRVESPLPSLRIGTAAMIEDYEFLRSGGSSDFLSAIQNGWKAPN